MDASAVSGHDPGFAEHLTGEDLRLLRSAGGMHDRGIEALLGDAPQLRDFLSSADRPADPTLRTTKYEPSEPPQPSGGQPCR